MLSTVLIIALLAAAGFAMHLHERNVWRAELASVKSERTYLRETLQRVKKDNARLHERLALMERTQQVQAKAYSDVDAHLRTLQEHTVALQEEVAFYRGIVTSDHGQGVTIQRLVMQRDGATDTYRYALVLTRNLRSDKVATGTVSLSIAGELGGHDEDLPMAKLGGAGSGVSFEFKYFKRIEGTIRLPRDFHPHRVSVIVNAPDETPAKLERSFDWNSVLG